MILSIKELKEALDKAEKEFGPDHIPWFVTKLDAKNEPHNITAFPIHHANIIGDQFVLSNVIIKEHDIPLGK